MNVDLNKLFSFVLNYWNPAVNNDELLRRILDIFKVDLALLYMVDFEDMMDREPRYSYFVSENVIDKKDNLDRIYFSGASKECMDKKEIINIGEYENYKHAVGEWKKAGIKSVVTVPVIRGDKLLGCLQIASLKDKFKFSKKEENMLSLISDILAMVIFDKLREQKLTLYEKIEDIHMNISSSLKDIANISLRDWLVENMKHILKISNAYVSGLIMPYDDIYCIVSVDDKFTVYMNSVNDEFKESITYKLFRMNVRNSITLNEAISKYSLELFERIEFLGLKDGIYVPVEYDGRIVAFFSFGFKEKIKNINYYKILLKNAGRHIFMSVTSFKKLANISKVLNQNEEQFVKALMKISEARDTYTKGHSERVAYYASLISKVLGKSDMESNLMYTAGLMHDIGKIGIPDSILLKPGKLSRHEFEIIKYHSLFSYEIVKEVGPLKEIAECIKYHHERCDGSGYPDGLKCKEIGDCARILAIADVFDALTSKRTYRDVIKYSPTEALELMKKMPLDKEIINIVSDTLIEHYMLEDNQEKLISIDVIDQERSNIFFKDYLTGMDRMTLFRKFVDEKVKQKIRFALVVMDIKNLGYINYTYGIDYANKLIEKIGEELMASQGVIRVMRDGADSFVAMCNRDDVGRVMFSLGKIEERMKEKFLKNDNNYLERLFYKTYVTFPDDGSSFEDLLYKLRLRLKQVRQSDNLYLDY